MLVSSFKRWIVGQPLASHRYSEEKITKIKALAVLSSDALSSVAYATEEILLALVAVSVIAANWSIPVALMIAVLMAIVTVSYRQTITTYSNGGGAYVVAKENLGVLPGLVAGAALMIDYLLTVAVSVAAGVSAVTSAWPELAAHKIAIGIVVILLITIVNLRGIRESATIFAFPTYLFIFLSLSLLAIGAFKAATGQVVQAAHIMDETYPSIALFVLLRAFSSGCAALTGIEAISNGVPAFEHPAPRNAKITLVWMAVLLSVLFFGITAISHVYGILPRENETVMSQLARGVFGEGVFYYAMQFATASILFLAANTSYSGFPWLAAVLASDRFLPKQLTGLGDRLVFSNSIIGLSLAAIGLLVLFDANTHALVPLYATGVFIGFTLSQSGMVRHHFNHQTPGWKLRAAVNAVGACTTGIVALVVGATKFSHGAWIVILLIPCMVYMFLRIRAHYLSVGSQLTLLGEVPKPLEKVDHTVIIPTAGIHRGVLEALSYAISISDDVRGVYVDLDAESTERMRQEWKRWCPTVPLVVLPSPYRSVLKPLMDYMDSVEQINHGAMITVVIPEFVTLKWWHSLLHNQTGLVIRAALYFRKRRVVTSIRYHLSQ